MAYKISGNASDANRAHVIKNGEYIGYKDVSSGAYDLVFDVADENDIMVTSEKSDGNTKGFGGITAVSTSDAVNITLPSSADLLKTGQTTSYATGDDGDLEKGVSVSISRVLESGDYVVEDSNTNLMWVADPESAGCNNGTPLSWTGAISFANNLTFAGYSDWRLPNVLEMLTTLTFELFTVSWGGYYTPTEFWYLGGGNYFPDRKDFWTSTTHGENTLNAWKINVAGIDGGLVSANYAKTIDSACLARPVRDM